MFRYPWSCANLRISGAFSNRAFSNTGKSSARVPPLAATPATAMAHIAAPARNKFPFPNGRSVMDSPFGLERMSSQYLGRDESWDCGARFCSLKLTCGGDLSSVFSTRNRELHSAGHP